MERFTGNNGACPSSVLTSMLSSKVATSSIMTITAIMSRMSRRWMERHRSYICSRPKNIINAEVGDHDLKNFSTRLNQIQKVKYALITGACKGIGKAIAYECASRKMNVLLISNDPLCLQGVCDDIRETKGVEAQIGRAHV